MQAEQSIPVKRETTAETAKRCRAKLKRQYPGVKFSVRSKSYSGGSSIYVGWTDGPTEPQVRTVTGEFAGAGFDAMQDLKTYKPDVLYANEDGALEIIDPGADYVLGSRTISQTWREEVAATIADVTGRPCDLTSWGDRGPDGEQVRRNGPGWDARYDALVVEEDCPACVWGTAADGTSCEVCDGRGSTRDTARIVPAVEGTQTYGRDLYYQATLIARA